MAEGTTQGILLVSDISGYTDFVRHHTRSASHARQITVRLLKAIVSAASPPLSVAELEGDAVFFYALGSEEEVPGLAKQVKDQIPRLFRAFAKELKVLSSGPGCSCHACACVAALRLKQVVHVGEVAVEKIGRFEKLFGLAVIIVHRMLKNSVPAKEYLMVSESAFFNFDGFFGLKPERRVVELDGIGEHRTMVFYAEQLASVQERLDNEEGPIPDPSLIQVLSWKLSVLVRTLLDMVARRCPPGEAC